MHIRSCLCSIRYNEMNISGILPSDKLPIFLLKPTMTPRHACLASLGDKTARVYASQKTGLAFRFGFKFPVGGSVPVQIYKLEPKGRCCRSDTTDANAVYIQLVKCKDFISCPDDLDKRKSTGTSCQIEIHFMIKTTEYLL
jgi:hypothetical protein